MFLYKNKYKGNRMEETQEIKTYFLVEMKDEYIGKEGTVTRDEYEYGIRTDVLGKNDKIRQTSA